MLNLAECRKRPAFGALLDTGLVYSRAISQSWLALGFHHAWPAILCLTRNSLRLCPQTGRASARTALTALLRFEVSPRSFAIATVIQP